MQHAVFLTDLHGSTLFSQTASIEKVLPFLPDYTTSYLVSPDSDPGTIIEWNTLAEHRGTYHHEMMKKLKDTKQLIALAEANDEIPPKPEEKVVWRF